MSSDPISAEDCAALIRDGAASVPEACAALVGAGLDPQSELALAMAALLVLLAVGYYRIQSDSARRTRRRSLRRPEE
ncbi:MAG: hypothetical protein AAFR52_16940 [Pseudomonadota bacterium]